MKLPIYMDNNATTPIDPRVLEAMMPYLTSEFGNPSSASHPFGWNADQAVSKARIAAARFIGAEPREVFFTAGATESNNTAIKGVFESYREKGGHIITQVTEHKSVLDPCKYLEKHGAKVTYLPVDAFGQISLDDLKNAITSETILISIMFANNEIGTIQPIEEIGKIAKENNIIFHVDAAQAAGKIPIDVCALGIDLLSLSAHKIYGPKGTGILYIRSKNPHVRITPLIHGGGQEDGMRSGTLNVPGIAAFAAACELASREMEAETAKLTTLRDRLKKGLMHSLDSVYLIGHPTERLANNLNLSFGFVEGDALIMAINDEIAVSTGSACSSKNVGPSYTLRALGLPGDRIASSIRFGLGRFNTEEEVDFVIQRVTAAVKKLRSLSPLYEASKTAEPI